MGYYIWRWSTIFKGPRATKFKEVWEIRRLESEAYKLDNYIRIGFPKEIKTAHTITHFLEKTIPKFIKNFEELCENCFKIEANQLSQDIAEIKEGDGVIKQLRDFWDKMPKNEIGKNILDIERKFLLKIVQEDKKDELTKRNQYNEVEAIINQAKKVDHLAFMAWLRTRIKNRAELRNVLEGYSWRRSVRISTRWILSIKKLRVQLRKLLESISKEINQSNFRILSSKLQANLDIICEGIRNYFRQSYLVRERAIVSSLKAFYNVEYVIDYLRESADKYHHELPKKQTEEAINKLNVSIEKVGKKFHDIVAQEFRIIINNLEKEEREAETLAKAA